MPIILHKMALLIPTTSCTKFYYYLLYRWGNWGTAKLNLGCSRAELLNRPIRPEPPYWPIFLLSPHHGYLVKYHACSTCHSTCLSLNIYFFFHFFPKNDHYPKFGLHHLHICYYISSCSLSFWVRSYFLIHLCIPALRRAAWLVT